MPRARPEIGRRFGLIRERLAVSGQEFGVYVTLEGWVRYQMRPQIATAETILCISGYA